MFNHLEYTCQISRAKLDLEHVQCSKPVQEALFKWSGFRTQDALNGIRFPRHANVVFRWKMLVTLTLFSILPRVPKGDHFTENILQVINTHVKVPSNGTIDSRLTRDSLNSRFWNLRIIKNFHLTRSIFRKFSYLSNITAFLG